MQVISKALSISFSRKKVNKILCLSVFWRWSIITAEEKLLENGYEDVKYLTNFSYDDALIGVTHDNRAVYDYEKMVE